MMKRKAFASLVIALWIVFAVQCASAQGISYAYDSLNRLVQAVYSDGTSIRYAYDGSGNRVSQVISNPSIPLPKVSVDKSTIMFSAAAGQAASS